MASAPGGNVVVLRRRCPKCEGFGCETMDVMTWRLRGQECDLCRRAGTVTAWDAAKFERQQKAQREAVVLP